MKPDHPFPFSRIHPFRVENEGHRHHAKSMEKMVEDTCLPGLKQSLINNITKGMSPEGSGRHRYGQENES